MREIIVKSLEEARKITQSLNHANGVAVLDRSGKVVTTAQIGGKENQAIGRRSFATVKRHESGRRLVITIYEGGDIYRLARDTINKSLEQNLGPLSRPRFGIYGGQRKKYLWRVRTNQRSLSNAK